MAALAKDHGHLLKILERALYCDCLPLLPFGGRQSIWRKVGEDFMNTLLELANFRGAMRSSLYFSPMNPKKAMTTSMVLLS